MLYLAIAITADHLCNHYLVPIKPVGLSSFGFLVFWVLHERLQCFQALPVIHISDAPGFVVFPAFLTQIASGLFGDFSNRCIQGIKALVKLFFVKNEGG